MPEFLLHCGRIVLPDPLPPGLHFQEKSAATLWSCWSQGLSLHLTNVDDIVSVGILGFIPLPGCALRSLMHCGKYRPGLLPWVAYQADGALSPSSPHTFLGLWGEPGGGGHSAS